MSALVFVSIKHVSLTIHVYLRARYIRTPGYTNTLACPLGVRINGAALYRPLATYFSRQ